MSLDFLRSVFRYVWKVIFHVVESENGCDYYGSPSVENVSKQIASENR